MTELIAYQPEFRKETVRRIAEFFGLHSSFLNADAEADCNEAEKTLEDWLEYPDPLYMIKDNNVVVGFLRIGNRGGSVAWIEDVFVDEQYRRKGIAARAIGKAEEIIKSDGRYSAICFDVVPRNETALSLYHKLGYDSLSILTVRKEIYDNKRDKSIHILGLDYKY